MRRIAQRAASLVLLAVACGPASDQAGPAVVKPKREATYDEAPGGREVVAKVDGVPIYGDCVATQARAAAPSAADDDTVRRAALDQCVAFELLAQEARRRGFIGDGDAVEAQRREAVRALIDLDFTPTLDSADDVPRADLARVWPQLERFFNHGELRTTYYCRVKLKRTVVVGSPEDLEGKALADELYAAVAGRTLDRAALVQMCGEATARHKMEINKKPYVFDHHSTTAPTDRAFDDAVFALPSVGRVTPPVRTAWGWDLILLSEITPPIATTFEQAAPELQRKFFYDHDFEGYRENRFLTWSSQFGKGVAVEVHPERLPPTGEIEAEALGAATGGAGGPAAPAGREAP